MSSFKKNLFPTFLHPLSINLRAPIWDVPLHLMWQQLAGGLLSLWADRRSTSLIPIHGGWMGKTEDSMAWGSNRSASPLLCVLSAHWFLLEEDEGEKGKPRGKRSKVLVFPWECSLGVKSWEKLVQKKKSSLCLHLAIFKR